MRSQWKNYRRKKRNRDSMKFTQIKSTAVPLPMEDIDTDQIIPARFLKSTSREGFGENLFRDWRYHTENTQNPDFILNNENFSGSILVAGKNFGCGSSREHAAWAIKDYGFDVVISSFFADIFKNNALNNQLLPLTVSPYVLDQIFNAIEENTQTSFEINLEEQTLKWQNSSDIITFEIDPFKKHCIINGMDTIDFLISKRDAIKTFENEHVVY